MNVNLRECRRCLTRELAGQEKTYRSLLEYIESIDPEARTPGTIYEDRLKVCKECEMLLVGMCRTCGCYVEVRAAVKKNGCPRKKW